MHAYTKGREVYLVHDNAVGETLKAVRNIQYDDERHSKGSFGLNCQNDKVSAPLFQIVSMIHRGCSVNDTSPAREQAALTIAQLIEFNTTFRSQNKSSSISNYHLTSREPPLPIYQGTLILSKTRNKTLIDKLYDVGISISYDKVLIISTELGNRVIDQFIHDKVVFHPSLKVGAFTTAAIDNIDHNPSSNTATSSFYGTAISLFQHPSLGKGDEKVVPDFQIKQKKLKKLPSYYTDIKPATLNKTITI